MIKSHPTAFGKLSTSLLNAMGCMVSANKGGVHICKLAYGDLTWENSSSPESYALWYTITGVYISTLGGLGSISCGQYLDRTLGKFPPLYGPHLPTHETAPLFLYRPIKLATDSWMSWSPYITDCNKG